jgi:hypothetical protein
MDGQGGTEANLMPGINPLVIQLSLIRERDQISARLEPE